MHFTFFRKFNSLKCFTIWLLKRTLYAAYHLSTPFFKWSALLMLLVLRSVIRWTFVVKIKATKTNVFHEPFLNSYKMLTKMCFSLILILFPNNFQSNFSVCFVLFVSKKCQSRERSGSTFNDS